MADSSHAVEIPGIENLELIGHGGFAKVYRGDQLGFRRTVAVKVIQRIRLDDEDRRRFERECQAMGTLSDHPNIVTLYDAGYTQADQPYLVMPYFSEGTLHDRIVATGGIGWQEALTVGVALCGALETSHQSGVLHRDVKPANVLMASYGVQLSDYGVARIADGHETQSGVITASVAHAPPEILDGGSPSRRADVYSLGSTIYEAIAGHSAFAGESNPSLGALIRMVMFEEPPRLEEFGAPESVAAVVSRAMSKDPTERFPDAAGMGEALRSAQEREGLKATPLVVMRPKTPDSSTEDVADRSSADDVVPTPPPDVTVLSQRATGSAPADVDTTPPRGVPVIPPPVSPPVVPISPTDGEMPRRSSGKRKAAAALGAATILGAGALVVSVVASGNDGPQDTASLATSAPAADDAAAGTAGAGPAETGPTDSQSDVSTAEVPVVPLSLPPGDPITLEFWHPGIQESAIQTMVESFEATQPGVEVEITSGPSYSGVLRNVVEAEPAARPDVVLVADRGVQTMLDMVEHSPVSEFIARGDFDQDSVVPSMAQRYSTSGGLAAMPFNVSAPMIFVNEDVLAQAGLDVAIQPDLSFSELRAACSALADFVEICLETSNDAYLFEQMVSNSGALMFASDNGRTGRPAEVVFDEGPVGRAVFDFMVTSVTDGIAEPLSGTPKFFEGDAAMLMLSSGSLGWISSNLADRGTPFTLGTAPFPHADGQEAVGAVAGGGALWILDSADDRRSIASWLLVEHLANSEQQGMLHRVSGYVPIQVESELEPGLDSFWSTDPVFRRGYDELLEATPGVEEPGAYGGRVGPHHDVDAAVNRGVAAARSGESTLDEAFAEVVDEADRVIDAYEAQQ